MTWILGAGFELQMAGSVTACDVVIAVGDSTKNTLRLLCACADRPIADGSLLDFMCQISTFGIYLVKLEVDIRQELNRQTDVFETITKHKGVGSYQDWSE